MIVGIGIGVGIPLFLEDGGGGITTLSMMGLDTNPPNDAATPGDHASISVSFPTGVTSWSSEAWGVGSYGDTTYGTGSSPTDYTASDGLQLLWEGLGDDGNTYRASAPIRYAVGTAPAVADGEEWVIGEAFTTIDGSASGSNLTFSYALSGHPAGVSINASTGNIDGTVSSLTSGTITITATDQYGRQLTDTFTFSVSAPVASLSGLTGGEARPGDHGSITVSTDIGTITARKWGSTSGGSEFGTGTNPTDYTSADTGDLYATVTVGGIDYTVSAPIRYAVGTDPAVADGQSWTVDDTSVGIDGSVTGTGLVCTYELSGVPSEITIDEDNGAITGTVTFAVGGASGSGTGTITATDQYGNEYSDTFTWSYALRTQATAAGALDLSFPEDSLITPVDVSTDWTANGNTLEFTAVDTPPTGLSLSSGGSLTGTPTTITADANYTFRATDEYGRTTDSEVAIEITSASSAPTLDTLTFMDNNDGTPAHLSITYTGDITGYRIYIATGDDTFDSDIPLADELYNETGSVSGVDEYANYAIGADIDITGLTSASNGSIRIAACLIRSSDGGEASNRRVVTVSGLDFTAPTFSDAEVGNEDADTLVINASEALVDVSPTTLDAGAFTLTGNTISAVAIIGGDIHLTLGTTATGGDNYMGDLSYTSDGEIVDADGNALASFSSEDVTNNVGGGGGSPPVSATTGSPTIDTGVSYNSLTGNRYTWAGAGSITLSGTTDVYYLIVAGGGGGASFAGRGGGGGAGGVLGGTVSDFEELSSGTYDVLVGAGGAEETNGGVSDLRQSGTSVIDVTNNGAIGGGQGGPATNNGGSGGGGCGTGSDPGGTAISGQGNAGGNGLDGPRAGGGGGGAGGVGQAAFDDSGERGGDGGDGITSSIEGSSLQYAGGGGGAALTGTPGSGAFGGGNGGTNTGASNATRPGSGGGGSQGGVAGSGADGIVVLFVPNA